MKNTIRLLMAFVFAVGCSKSGKTYYCQCTITTAVGSGTYIGAKSASAKAEGDCNDKKAEVEAEGQTANCAVIESVD